MKARYVVIGSIMIAFCGILFAGMQEVNAALDRGLDGAAQDVDARTPEQAARYGMSQEIAGWSQLVEIAAFVGGAVSVAVLGYGIVSTDSAYSIARART
jgi:hypothetical protein